MLRYTTDRARRGLVASYDMWPGNGAGLFFQPQSPHGASTPKPARGSFVLLLSGSHHWLTHQLTVQFTNEYKNTD